MGEREGGRQEGRHCRWIHEWERLRGLGGGEIELKKEEWERLCGLGVKKKIELKKKNFLLRTGNGRESEVLANPKRIHEKLWQT